MSFFNPNSFDAHDDRLYDQPEKVEDRIPEPSVPEELPEALVEAIEPVGPSTPTGSATSGQAPQQQATPNPFQARMDEFTKRYAGGSKLDTTASEGQEAAALSQKLMQADNLMKAILMDPALNKPSDAFTQQHIVAIKKYLQGTMYYCELLKDDLVKSKLPNT